MTINRFSSSDYALGLGYRAKAKYASRDGVHAEGVIIGYTDAPTYTIVTSTGRTVPWRADLTEVGEPATREEYTRCANARRLRDGRDTVRPELREQGLPLVTVGMSVLEIYERVIAHGLNPARVVIDYEGCGTHDITLEEDTRSQAEIEAELEEKRLREVRRVAEEIAREQREAEAEAADADPTIGWD